jgi:hypothetical protein
MLRYTGGIKAFASMLCGIWLNSLFAVACTWQCAQLHCQQKSPAACCIPCKKRLLPYVTRSPTNLLLVVANNRDMLLSAACV